MLTRIEIDNFKSIDSMAMECNNLNVLIGTNSSGKSTINQALLFVGQNSNNPTGLNGDFVKLGELDDVNCIYSNKKSVNIRLFDGNGDYLNTYLGRNVEDNTLELTFEGSCHPNIWDDELSVKKRRLQYLSCHRIGPQNFYRKNMEIDELIDPNGEYAISYLCKHATDLVDEKLRKNTQDYTLLGQVNWWLNYMVSAQISTEEIQGVDLIKASYQMNDLPRLRPVNIGSGISYLISILIMCLSSPEGGIIVIENPEIHLHPSAQSKVCEFLYFISQCGKQLFIETHSDHIFNGFRVGIATGNMSKEDVNICFVYLNENHVTETVRVQVGKYGIIENQHKDLFDQFDIDLNKMIGV